jgi:hypothetical protein
MTIFHHPSEVGMTYVEHMMFSLSLAGKFAYASILAIIHAFYPDIFVTSSTDAITTITHQINHRQSQIK